MARIHTDQEYLATLRKSRRAVKNNRDATRYIRRMAEYDELTGAVGRQGVWMPTYSGRRFWLLDARPDDFELEDIAHGLSRTSRFFGATKWKTGYTVAQHCVLGSYICEPKYSLAFLLHDAPEAYVGDVITPLKHLLGTVYEEIENRIMVALAHRFNCIWNDEVRQAVKRVDRIMLATEVRDLLPCKIIREDPGEEPLPFTLRPWSQRKAKREYLARFPC